MTDDAVTTERTTLDVGDGRGRSRSVDVQYYAAGEGDPLVLLHGIGPDAAAVSWRYALPALARERRVYALDFPGHGASEKPRARYTTAYFRSVLESFLDDLEIEEPALAGVSMGGAVALGHGLENPVDGLALVGSYGLGEDAHWRPAASVMLRVPMAHRRWWKSVGSSRGSVREHLRTMTRGTPPTDLVDDVYDVVQDADVGRTVRSWQRSEFRAGGFRTDYSARLDELDTDLLLVHGAADPLVPAHWARTAASTAPRTRLELMEDCGHWPSREAPERFNRALSSFLT